MKIPVKVSRRLVDGLKKFQPILAAARSRDVNESDTVVLVTDILSEVLGYEKYTEITSEHMIRGTFCDLAVHVDGDLAMLLEVKAIGLDLKDQHTKQAVDYAANKGCDWVTLTNGVEWRVYQVIFGKPIDKELIAQVDLCTLNHRTPADLEVLWAISKEGWRKSRLSEYAAQQQALSRFAIGAAVLSEPVLAVLRRELRRMSPEARIDTAQIREILLDEVIKREVIEGDKASEAKRAVTRAARRAASRRAVRTDAVKEEVAKAAMGEMRA
jgi:predicted type IV restriction endonuclease